MPRFVIHKHYAKRAGIHYDLRIEVGNKLYSFACRKGIPTTTGKKVLLVRQPDHEKKWLNFQGEIPSGEYGAGKLVIWDKGTYNLVEKNDKVLVLNFKGNKIKGRYIIVKLEKNNYLIFKSNKKEEKKKK